MGPGSNTTAGGTVVANDSSASVVRGAMVDLTGNAGQDARALNVGNAADSAVANAVNIWDGRLEGQDGETGLDVSQSNSVEQSDARAASIWGYGRDASSIETSNATTDTSSTGSSELITNTMVDTLQTVGGGGLSIGGSDGQGSDDVGGSGGTGANSLAVPEAEVQVGKGVALGGTVDFSVGPATIDVGIDVGASMTNSTRNITKFDSGQVDVAGAAAKGPSGSNEFHNDFEMGGDVSVDFALQTPEINMDVAGSGCFVMVGKCAADATETAVWADTASSTDDHYVEQRGALDLGAVAAEYIVVDASTLTLEAQYSVALSGEAQHGARALNLTNAAGSLVSNAVNVSRTPTVGPALALSQQNSVVQHR